MDAVEFFRILIPVLLAIFIGAIVITLICIFFGNACVVLINCFKRRESSEKTEEDPLEVDIFKFPKGRNPHRRLPKAS